MNHFQKTQQKGREGFEELGAFTEDGVEPIIDFLRERVDENGNEIYILDWLDSYSKDIQKAVIEDVREMIVTGNYPKERGGILKALSTLTKHQSLNKVSKD